MKKEIIAPTNQRVKEGKACDMNNCKGCDKPISLTKRIL